MASETDIKNKVCLLDNPVWNSLQTIHQALVIGTSKVIRYPKDVLPSMALETAEGNLIQEILPYFDKGERLFLVGEQQVLPDNWSRFSNLECLQMVWSSLHSDGAESNPDINELLPSDRLEMFDFINTIQPGYFKINTPRLGHYYGIRVNGKLVAMAGERLKMTGYTEVSAVCTHPDFTGKGFARQLLLHLFDKITKTGSVPFLHVAATNERAVNLYKYLGFEERRRIDFSLVGPS